MSLHIGNLSSHARKDKLEQVFRKFGRCDVRIKAGYGFVDYDFPASAERALKMLQGRKICGERLTLKWSYKQQKPSKRYAGANRSYDRSHGQDSSRRIIDHPEKRLGPDGIEDLKVGIEKQESKDGGPNSAVIVDEDEMYNLDYSKGYVREEHHENNREDHAADNDRQGVDLNVSANESFERYKPDRGYDSKTDGAEKDMVPEKKSRGKIIGEVNSTHVCDLGSQRACYICGGLGHQKQNCPTISTSIENCSYNTLDRQGRGTENSRRHREEHRSRGIRSSAENPETRRPGRGKRILEDSQVPGNLMEIGSSHMGKEPDGSREKGSNRKKLCKGEDRSPKVQSARRARGSLSSPFLSDCAVAKSPSKPKSSGQFHRSVSLSCRSRSMSPTSGNLCHSRSLSPKSRLRASTPSSLSVSESLGVSLPFSPNRNKVLIDSSVPETDGVQFENGRSFEADVQLETNKASPKLNSDDELVISDKIDDKMEKEQLSQGDNIYKVKMDKLLQEVRNQKNQDSHVSVNEIASEPATEADLELPPSSFSHQTTSISPEELYMVLKHYGLQDPNGDQKCNTPIETYFGSARLWPWDIIYYRRLKKGPISVDNYARRLTQNEEFGIVDKYIRSSSGWGEPEHALQ